MTYPITFLSHELQKLHIRKKPNIEKKYIIDVETRNKIKEYPYSTFCLIPFISITNPIHNPKKELFLNQTSFLTQKGNLIHWQSNQKNDSIEIVKKYILENLNLTNTDLKIKKY